MIHLFEWVGLIVTLAFCIIAIMALLDAIGGKVVAIQDRMAWANRDIGRREAGAIIAREAYWYSESVEAQKALEIVGRGLMAQGYFDAQRTRSDWRESIKPTETPEAL